MDRKIKRHPFAEVLSASTTVESKFTICWTFLDANWLTFSTLVLAEGTCLLSSFPCLSVFLGSRTSSRCALCPRISFYLHR